MNSLCSVLVSNFNNVLHVSITFISHCYNFTFKAIEESFFALLDTLSDVIYIIDIAVHLRISFYEDGCLVRVITRIILV